jgi:ATP-dependent RNA helicase DeaD
MICKAGGITKRDLGTIRIENRETHVELNAAVVDRFFAQLGEGGRLEKQIVAMPMREQEHARPERSEPPQRQQRQDTQDSPKRGERPTERQDRQERQERTASARPGRKERQSFEPRRGKPPAGKSAAGKHPAGKHPAGGKPHKKKKTWNPAD